MSYEAWGTPPEPEPRYCPVCDQQSHDQDCELGKMQARAFIAEQQRDRLIDALRPLITSRMGAEQIREGIQRAIASVKGGA